MARLAGLLPLLLVLLQLALEAPEVTAEPSSRTSQSKGYRRFRFRKTGRKSLSGGSLESCNCILLQDCPALHKLLLDDTMEGRKTVRNAICGFQGTRSKVCCPEESTKLPEDCGDVKIDDQRFVGRVTQPGLYPWLALLGYKEPGSREVEFLCGGTVITDKHILTSAHCVHQSTLRTKSLVTVRVGEHSIHTLEADLCPAENRNHPSCRENHVDLRVDDIIIYPAYRPGPRYSFDIAIVKVKDKIRFNDFVQPICLASPNVPPIGGLTTESGWSLEVDGTEFGRLDVVHQKTLSAVTLASCNTTFKGIIEDHMLCARPRRGSPPICLRASGGMVFLSLVEDRYSLLGIPAFGHSSCSDSTYPDAYISVAFFNSWIRRVIQQ
ncbi:phenoloxidase-activating factor 1-like [Oratosquilla oratoria]|uniref:phenoloxidase-activating factor 1-like n=1 Tax=Oratosquilla oratoria TaxID=337810 RepID=UPI003F75B445